MLIRRILVFIPLVLFAFLLVSCSQTQPQTPTDTQAATPASVPDVSLLSEPQESAPTLTTEPVGTVPAMLETNIPTLTSEPIATVPAVNMADTAAPDSICATYGAVGVQAAVLQNGRLAATYEYGLADSSTGQTVTADTCYRVASLSKLVTDIVYMRLYEEGYVSLYGDISEPLGFTVRSPYYPDTVITAAMLMSHTAGIADGASFLQSRNAASSEPLENLLLSADNFYEYEPGSTNAYSNLSVAVIGCICEKATGKSFAQLSKEYVFDPLGIDAAYTASGLQDTSRLGVLYGSGGMSKEEQFAVAHSEQLGQTHHLVQGNLTISAKDFLRIAAVLCNNGKTADGVQLLTAESVAEMLVIRSQYGEDKAGFGFWLQDGVFDGRTMLVHTGSNFGMYAAFAMDPTTGNGVAVLTSGADGSRDSTTQIYRICLELIRSLWPNEN